MIRDRGYRAATRYKKTGQRRPETLNGVTEIHMPKNKQTAFHINLMCDAVPGAGCYIRSPDVPGLHLVGKTLQAMKPMIEEAVKLLFKLNRQIDVNVIWIAEAGSFKSKNPVAETLAVYKAA